MSFQIPAKTISQITQKIIHGFSPEKIILFGSYAWGKPTPNSDLDFLILKKTKKPRLAREYELRMKLIGNKFPPMDFIIYTPQELKNRLTMKDFFIQNITKQGKILYAK